MKKKNESIGRGSPAYRFIKHPAYKDKRERSATALSDAMVKLRMRYELWKLYAWKNYWRRRGDKGRGMTFNSCRLLCAFRTVNTACYAIEENLLKGILDAFVYFVVNGIHGQQRMPCFQ